MNSYVIIIFTFYQLAYGFEVGIRRTTCNLSQQGFNDPCMSLYGAICDGAHCKCPPGSHESKTLKRCVKGPASKPLGFSGSSGDDLFDLPFDYVPDKDKGKTRPKTDGTISSGTDLGFKIPNNTNRNIYPPQRGGYPQQPGGYPQRPGGYPQQPSGHPQRPGGHPQQPGGYPQQPGGYPQRPGGYPQQPGGYPNQPGYSNRPGYPNQPSGYPNQPGYPRQPSGYPRQPSSTYGRGGKDPRMGEKAGGGIGGVIGLIIIIALIYFCCCKGGKGKKMTNMMSKFKKGGKTQDGQGGQYVGAYGGGGGQYAGEYGGGGDQYAGGYGGGGGAGYPVNQFQGQMYATPTEQGTQQTPVSPPSAPPPY